MKRRDFLRNSSLLSIPTFFGGFQLAAMPNTLNGLLNDDSDKVLVLIDLNGGNDGLNTFVPLDGYDNLMNARTNVMLPQNKLIDFTDTISLHPSMQKMRELWDNSNLTVIQGVGYHNQNRSHFRSSDIWNTAVEADEYKNTGWFGRYLDDQFPNYPYDYPNSDCPDPFAITMGRSISGTCQGVESNFSMAIINVNDLGGLDSGIEVPLPNDCYGDELGFLIETFKKSNAYGERVVIASDAGANMSSLYPNTDLGQQLKTVAKLISGGLQTKIYVLKLGGFDTHADQVDPNDTTQGWHAILLERLSEAVHAFQDDLYKLGLHERVVGMTFSEFGRKIISNAGIGTDHGSAAPLMVFGHCINAGIIGANPIIGDQVGDEEGVAMQYDFKSVYGSILMDWFGAEESKIKEWLTPDFQYIPILVDCTVVNTLDQADVSVEAKAFPNPCDTYFQLTFELESAENVRIDISDSAGRHVKTVTNQNLPAGPHQVYVEMHQVPAGPYFARIQVGNGVKVLRMMKQ